MGGHACGEMASGLSVHTIQSVFEEKAALFTEHADYSGRVDLNPIAQLLNDSMRQASILVYEKGQENAHLRGMGTTTISMLFHQNTAFIAHVGDSRCYLVRNDEITQLSEDHSLVNEQLKAKIIDKHQAEQSRFKNIITRSVGVDPNVEIDMIAVETMPRDVFLLCSDGLTGHVKDFEINEIINSNYLHEVPGRLIALANERGGEDNITVVLMYVPDENHPPILDASDWVDPIAGGAAYNAGFIE
jgi:PPM family protein phosphatase